MLELDAFRIGQVIAVKKLQVLTGMVGHGKHHPLKFRGAKGKERFIGKVRVFCKRNGRRKKNPGGFFFPGGIPSFQNIPADFLLHLFIGQVHPGTYQHHVFLKSAHKPVQLLMPFR